jgi:hypothetical protein
LGIRIQLGQSIVSNEPEPVGSVTLRGVTVPIDSDLGRLFVTDLARDADGIAIDLKQKWDLSDEAIVSLETNEPLIRALRAEVDRRRWMNISAREIAQANLPAAVRTMVHMTQDRLEASARKIDASKFIKDVASAGGAAGDAGRDPVQITIITSLNGPPRVIDIPAPMPADEPPTLPPIVIGRASPEGPARPADDAEAPEVF